MQTVARTAARICGADYSLLLEEARRVVAEIEAQSEKSYFRLSDHEVEVDVPELDYTKTREIDPPPDDVEKALYHPSGWIALLATNFFERIVNRDALVACTKRLYESGRGTALLIASYYAKEIGSETAEPMTRHRLRQQLAGGCDHLFDLLTEFAPNLDEDLLDILRNGLLHGDVKTATSAGKLAAIFDPSADSPLVSLLWESYRHWRVTEDPYPEKGGVIPKTPRPMILSALVRVALLDDETVLDAASDQRSEISSIAKPLLLSRLMSDGEICMHFLDAIRTEQLSASLLVNALDEKVPFSGSEVEKIFELLSSPNARLRYAASGVLCREYVSDDEVRRWLNKLKSDPELEIREAAERLASQLD